MNPTEANEKMISAAEEVLRNARVKQRTARPAKMEFSKKIILLALFYFGASCIVSLVSWFITGDWPREIFEEFSWPFAVIVTGYLCKSAYENKYKIQGGDRQK